MENIEDPSIHRSPIMLQSEDLLKGFIATRLDVGQLITLLLKLLNAKKTIELGVFTGYSLLLTALSIPEDGKITAVDINRKAYDEVRLPFIKKAGAEHKIDFISPALPILDRLLQDPANFGTFDFAYIDNDEGNYVNYHERLIKLVKVGGSLVYDNTLGGGRVALPEEKVPMPSRLGWQGATQFNNAIIEDSRVEIALASVGDGLTICRRIA